MKKHDYLIYRISVILLLMLVIAGCTGSTITKTDRVESTEDLVVTTVATETDIPTPVPTITLFQQPTHTAESRFASFDTMILMRDFGSTIFLQDVNTGEIRQLKGYWNFIKWQDQGCSFFVWNQNGDILHVDLNGNVLQSFFSYDELVQRDFKPFRFKVALSPDDQWIWFWKGSGEPYNIMGPDTRLETQNIYAVSIDLKSGPFPISENGGAWLGEWSPNGAWIAYSDYDDKHVHQVFVATREGEERFQLTNFHEISQFDQESAGICRIRWSPDSQRIVVYHFENQDPQIAIYDLENRLEVVLLENMRGLWWMDTCRLVGFREDEDFVGISIYDTCNGKLENIVSQSDYSYLQHISPYMTDDKIGFFSWKETSHFYVYDGETGEIEHIQNINGVLDMLDWVATPLDFPGENVCGEEMILETVGGE